MYDLTFALTIDLLTIFISIVHMYNRSLSKLCSLTKKRTKKMMIGF